MVRFEHYNPVRVIFGTWAADRLGELDEIRGRRCLVAGYEGFDAGRLGAAREAAAWFGAIDGFEETPTVGFVRRAAERVRADRVETIIAVGGGSTIDTAKAAAALAADPGWKPGDPVPSRTACRVVAVPTTAGTGSEVTQYAIIADEAGVKRILPSPALYPAAAVCDPLLTLALPPAVTANTGVDAISHGVEAYLNRRCDGFLDALAFDCLTRAAECLPAVLAEPGNVDARAGMMLAALEGGLVLAACGTVVVHAMGYGLSKAWGLAHGKANGLLLGRFVEAIAAKGNAKAARVQELFGGSLGEFIAACGMTPDPARHVLTADLEREWVALGTASYGLPNSVEPLSEADVREILVSSLG